MSPLCISTPPKFTKATASLRCAASRPARLSRRSLATHTRLLPDPSQKYAPYTPVHLHDRQWPSKIIRSAPIWLSTDLRDGNQALPNPMSVARKQKLFQLLLHLGFKEIEVAFPSASEVEFGFVRSLIESGQVPDDVWLQVLSPCRPELIKRTLESVAGAKKVIVHIYAGIAPLFRNVVFQKSRAETLDLALKNTALVRDLTNEYAERYGTQFRFNFGVESFSQAEPDYALEVCEEVKRTWGKAGIGADRLTFNLAASVEIAPPNHFADQVEFFSRNISEREKVLVSLHPHNDMGTAVAAAQMGLLAGADRVEGCLLGQGERTGNVDLITMALNQFSQGIAPRLDLTNLPAVLDVLEECTGLPVHPRYPYSGKLVFTAFSGSHQDAIKKGFEAQEKRHAQNRTKGESERWSIPYLPFDPADIGCSYEALIRVNSQSGKAGVASLLQQGLGLDLPREMQIEFYKVIQREAERTGTEVSQNTIVRAFRDAYHIGPLQRAAARIVLRSFRVVPPAPASSSSPYRVDAEISVDGASRVIHGSGANPQAALLSALGRQLKLDFALGKSAGHDNVGTGGGGKAASCVQVSTTTTADAATATTSWGAGMSSDSQTAQLRAVVSAVNAVLNRLQPVQHTTFVPGYTRVEYPRPRAAVASAL